jgi:ankyrin repeat protein
MFFIHGIGDAFVAAKVDINARDNEGNTPLHLAAETGTKDVFDWLVQHGASLDATNNAGQTPRELALNTTNAYSPFRFNPDTDLFQAIRNGKLESVAAILKAQPDLLNKPDQNRQTPLLAALQAKHTNIAGYLEKQGAQWDAVSAVLAGRDNVLRDLITQQPYLITNSFGGQNLLHLAAANGQVVIVKQLLVAGTDLKAPDIWGLSPLGVALAQHQTSIANLFREQGARENIFDAVSFGDFDAVKVLLAKNKSLALATNKIGMPVTFIATALGQAEILKQLLDDGAPLPHGNTTLLHIAAIYNQTNTAALLIQRGVEVEAFDLMGYTPLQLAASEGSTETAMLLLKHGWFRHGANPNTGTLASAVEAPGMRLAPHWTFTGNTALHLATLNAQTNMIVLLLKSGASVNATNSAGMTPLDFATQNSVPFAGSLPGAFPNGIFRFNFEPGILPQSTNPFQSRVRRQRIAASLLEEAGARHGTANQQNIWGPRLIPR